MSGESVGGVSSNVTTSVSFIRPQKDPETVLQEHMTEHNITDPEVAKAELEKLYGKPEQPGGVQGVGGSASMATSTALSTGDVDGTGRQPSIPPEAMQLHQIYGIPLEVIQEGDNAIQQYAKENNITLPQKTQGNLLNLES